MLGYRNSRGPLPWILPLALFLRLAALFWWEGRYPDFFFGDSEGYWLLGQRLAAGEPYEVYGRVAGRTPGYPLLLAPLFVIGGPDLGIFWGRLQNVILGTLVVAAVWWLARLLFDRRTAHLAALFTAVLPNLIFHSVVVLAETPYTLFLLVGTILWVQAWRADALGRRLDLAAGAGVLQGLAVLIRPSGLLLMPFVIGCAMAMSARTWKRHLALAIGLLAGMTVVLSPWWIRNAAITGRFVPTSTLVGASLYDGLNPGATGASDMTFESQFPVANHMALPRGQRELAIDADMRAAAIAWARENPDRVAQLAVVKLCRMWSPVPNAEDLRSVLFQFALALSFTPIAVLSLCGAAVTLRRGFEYWLCWLPAVYFTLLHMVFVSSVRYRAPFMPLLCVLAAAAFLSLWDRVGRRRRHLATSREARERTFDSRIP